MITKPTTYTRAFVKKELAFIRQYLLENTKCIWLGIAIQERPYSLQRFSEWVNDFKDDDEISESLKKIKEILESRIVDGAMRNKFNVAMSIFNLKNNYNWKDQHDVTTAGLPIKAVEIYDMSKPKEEDADSPETS